MHFKILMYCLLFFFGTPLVESFFHPQNIQKLYLCWSFLILKHQVHSTLEGECYDPQQFSNRLMFEGSVSLGPLFTSKLSKIYFTKDYSLSSTSRGFYLFIYILFLQEMNHGQEKIKILSFLFIFCGRKQFTIVNSEVSKKILGTFWSLGNY